MSRLSTFLSRLFGWLGGKKRDAELRAEIDAHLAEAAEEFERQGVPADEARRQAFVRFGGVTQTMEAHRDRRRFRPFGSFGRDIAYGVRMLVRSPGFTLVTVLTLAIGILANTTTVSAVNALLFRPLAIENPAQVHQIFNGTGRGGEEHVDAEDVNRELRGDRGPAPQRDDLPDALVLGHEVCGPGGRHALDGGPEGVESRHDAVQGGVRLLREHVACRDEVQQAVRLGGVRNPDGGIGRAVEGEDADLLSECRPLPAAGPGPHELERALEVFVVARGALGLEDRVDAAGELPIPPDGQGRRQVEDDRHLGGDPRVAGPRLPDGLHAQGPGLVAGRRGLGQVMRARRGVRRIAATCTSTPGEWITFSTWTRRRWSSTSRPA